MRLRSVCELGITRGLCVALIGVSTVATLAAQSQQTDRKHHHKKVYTAHVVSVPLQPFSMERRSTRAVPGMQVAYYSPRSVRRVDPVEGAEENSETISRSNAGRSHPIVRGNRAVLRHGIAYAPSNAPDRVKAAIWAVNTIHRKPYIWGGGHGSFYDRGYDCSGTVSFALHYARALDRPLASSELLRYGERGRGRWITIYSRRGHTFAVIAGLRLDTTDFRYGGDVGPRWHVDGRSTWGFEARHPAGL
jgi:hypothetical protein